MSDDVLFSKKSALRALKSTFGYDDFRPGQLDVMKSLAKRRHVLVVMPTGKGKSLCYQIPAICSRGTALVVSPLIALMKDQVDELRSLKVKAGLLNSTLTREEADKNLRRLENGWFDLFYVTPERFKVESFRRILARIDISFLAIDEAHCISQWGHDFRIDYRRLGNVRKLLGVPTIALTATATVIVQDDIVNQLKIDEEEVDRHIHGFDRPNLFYQIKSFDDGASRDAEFSDQIRKMSEGKVAPAIIYCGTRKQCEHVTVIVKKITGKQLITYYHAGMKPERRKDVQEAFMDSDVPWVAATNAFGMGVNKPDVRHVLHYGLPGSIEAWYQEVGRAGRDEKRADCITMYTRSDVSLLWYFLELSNPSREAFQKVWDVIWQFKEPIVRMTYKEVYGKYVDWFGKKNPQGQIETAIQLLKKAGAIDNQSPRGQLILADYPKKKDVSHYLDFEMLYEKRQKDASKLRQLVDFVEDKRPIRERVLKYFGEK